MMCHRRRILSIPILLIILLNGCAPDRADEGGIPIPDEFVPVDQPNQVYLPLVISGAGDEEEFVLEIEM